jgi:hypothetical protein
MVTTDLRSPVAMLVRLYSGGHKRRSAGIVNVPDDGNVKGLTLQNAGRQRD